MARPAARVFDLREGELRITLASGIILFFIVGGHTMLETARDALFLTKLPPRTLNLVYVAVAALSFVVSGASAKTIQAVGRRRALILSLFSVALITSAMSAVTLTSRVIFGVYVFSGLVGGLLPTQFWTLAAQLFTVGEGRRLFGLIAAGGVIGGVVGAGASALVVGRAPVATLLPMASVLFFSAAVAVMLLPARSDTRAPSLSEERKPALIVDITSTFRTSPFLFRIAALTVVSTATVLTVDYLFKSTAAAKIPPAELGAFFARYYAVLNVVSLVVQLFLASKLVSRLGVLGATGIMPFGLFVGGVASALTAGALPAILSTKGLDGSFRYSLHRVTTELLYLAVPARARDRAKAIIDAVLVRLAQAAMAGILFGFTALGFGSSFVLGLVIAGLSSLWLFLVVTLRRPYLELFRRAIREGTIGEALREYALDELDLESAEAAVESLASLNVDEVIAAMNLLARRHHARLVPALVLYHAEPRVLVRALQLFSDSARRDWIPLGKRLAGDERADVRMAAIRALARVGHTDVLAAAENDDNAQIRAYASYHFARTDGAGKLMEHPRVVELLESKNGDYETTMSGMIAAISDTPDPRSVDVLITLFDSNRMRGNEARPTARMVRQLARTLAIIKDDRMIPYAINRLQHREGRDSVREVLVSMGDRALDALIAALHDPKTPRSVRVHIPQSIGQFRNQRASNVLTRALVEAPEGLVRYKALRGLAAITAVRRVKVDRALVAREGVRSLVEHLRMLSLRQALGLHGGSRAAADASARLLDELLVDKVEQALDRAFRLLEVIHRREDILRARAAISSGDGRMRAHGVEFIDTLLSRRDTREMREVFRIVLDDVEPAERIERAAEWLGDASTSRMDALAALLKERDEVVAVMAAYYSLTLGDPNLSAAVQESREARPSLRELGTRFFGPEAATGE
jgi:AAA family ATP:ADP antiporter